MVSEMRKEIYKIWAPAGKKWVDWVRPVPFVGLDVSKEMCEFVDYTIPSINYFDEFCEDTAILIDINGVDSIKEGIALSRFGYRPIPIFNGTNPLLLTNTLYINNSFPFIVLTPLRLLFLASRPTFF